MKKTIPGKIIQDYSVLGVNLIYITCTLTETTLPLVPVIHSGFGYTTFQTYYKTAIIPQSYTFQEMTQCRRKYGKIRLLETIRNHCSRYNFFSYVSKKCNLNFFKKL